MKYSLAASFAMAALVGAAPLNNKRDMVYSTATVEEWVTVWSTQTVWEGEPTAAAASSTPVGGFYEVHSSARPTSAAASSTKAKDVKPSTSTSSVSSAAPSSSSTPAAPVVTSSTSSSTSIAAPSTSSTSTYVAPTTSTSTYVAPTTSSTSVAPVVVPSTTAAPVAATSTKAAYVAPAATTSASTSSGGYGTSTGDMTYYDVSVGLTSCGLTGSNSDFLVAMNKPDMGNGANPNNNPHCNQYINIYYNGVGPIKGKVVDTCPECVSGSIDVTDSLFKVVAPNGDGRVKGVSWSWA